MMATIIRPRTTCSKKSCVIFGHFFAKALTLDDFQFLLGS